MTRKACSLAIACCLIGFIGACGSSASSGSKPTTAFRFTKCSVAGTLQVSSGAAAPRSVAGDACVGGVFDGGDAGMAMDVAIEVGGRAALVVTLNAATSNQSVSIEAPSAPLDDQSGYLGANVPPGVVWVRHSRGPGSGAIYAPMHGGVSVGAFRVVPLECGEYCNEGTVTLELTFDHATWDSPSGAVEFSGKVVVSANGGDPSCTTSSECAEGRACNESDSNSSYCGRTNAGGADLGQACASSDACKSNDCDAAGQCSLFCKTDDDCGNGTACAQNYRNFLKTCVRTCQSNADCGDLPSGAPCAARGNADSTALVGGCGGGAGNSTFAQPTGAGCDTALSIVPLGLPAVCTRFCRTNADCAAPLPTCAARSFRESAQAGAAVTTLMVCQ